MSFQPGEQAPGSSPFPPGQSGNPAGYKKGVPNRGTLLRRLLKLNHKIDDPLNEGETITVTVKEAMTWGIIGKAMAGDVNAYKEIMDTMHGKIIEKVELKDTTDPLAKLTDEELSAELRKYTNDQ